MLRIKLVRSPIGHNKRNRATIQALGLRKVHQVKLHQDTPTIRGMIHHVKELLQVEVVEDAPQEPATETVAEEPKAKKPRATKPKDEPVTAPEEN